MGKNIFGVGLDEANLALLNDIPQADQYEFHQLLTFHELQEVAVSVPDLLDKAQRQLDAFEGSIDAIIGYLDFPVSVMVPILCQRYGLYGADLEAAVKCEHKYWSRLEQRKVIDDYPAFDLLDLDGEITGLPPHVSYPVWIKPVVAHSSQGAHYAENGKQLQQAVDQERRRSGQLGGPFDDVLAMLELPPEIEEVGAQAYLVEEAATGDQFTVEGFSYRGQTQVYGVVDSVTYEDYPSFLRYQYPSVLSERVRDHMIDVSAKVVDAVGLTDTTFNIEYFWDPTTQKLRLLEINARHSQSHATLFEEVDGVSNHATMVSLALGEQPHCRENQGSDAAAAKWFMRRFRDGLVHRVPTSAEVAELQRQVPGTHIEIAAQEGTRLSAGINEDSFSYVLAEIFTSGDGQADLIDKYNRCLDTLNFDVQERDEGA